MIFIRNVKTKVSVLEQHEIPRELLEDPERQEEAVAATFGTMGEVLAKIIGLSEVKPMEEHMQRIKMIKNFRSATEFLEIEDADYKLMTKVLNAHPKKADSPWDLVVETFLNKIPKKEMESEIAENANGSKTSEEIIAETEAELKLSEAGVGAESTAE